MEKTFKCKQKGCKSRKDKSITQFAGIYLRGKLYCLECALRLNLIYIYSKKPRIMFKL